MRVRAAAVSAAVVTGVAAHLWCIYLLWRSKTNRHRPRRIYLIRHGESEGNVDQHLFQFVADHAIPLTVSIIIVVVGLTEQFFLDGRSSTSV